MNYTIFVERYAIKQLNRINKTDIPIIKSAIAALSQTPRPVGYIKLKRENAYRIRIGKYRIIYEIDDTKITAIVVTLGHRKSVYRKK